MLFITYQSKDYKEYKNPKYRDVKKLLNIPEDKNIYWCIKANNLQQAIINSYCCEPNQPFYMVMFETDDYYEIDAVKWNYDVLTKESAIMNEEHLKLEHDYAVEYIVTDIPEKRVEVEFPIANMFEKLTHLDSLIEYRDYYELLGPVVCANKNVLDLFPSGEDFKDMMNSFECDYKTAEAPQELKELRIHYILSVGLLLPMMYIAARKYLLDEDGYKCQYNFRYWKDLVSISNASPNNGCIEYKDMYSFELSWKNYRRNIYKQLFMSNKEPYPNDPCPCGSGKKYKKCCAKVENKMDELLRE